MVGRLLHKLGFQAATKWCGRVDPGRPRLIRKLKAAPGKNILTDGSHELVHTLLEHDLVDELHLLLYPLILGGGKRLLPERVHLAFKLKAATPYPSGVVGLHYERSHGDA